jgi:DNA-binding response OmpR family regulator
MIVEDDIINARVIGHVLDEAGYAVTIARNAAEAMVAATTQPVALVIMDIGLGDVDGFDAALNLRSAHYIGPIIFLSGRGSLDDKLRGFEIGADDYVVKPVDPLELVSRVNSVIRRFEAAQSRSMAAVLRVDDAELALGDLTYSSAVVRNVTLAPTELKLLDCLMRNARIIISRDVLIERVWGFDSVGDTNRVDVYIRRLRRKIELDAERPEYLHTVRGVGYVFKPTHQPMPN